MSAPTRSALGKEVWFNLGPESCQKQIDIRMISVLSTASIMAIDHQITNVLIKNDKMKHFYLLYIGPD